MNEKCIKFVFQELSTLSWYGGQLILKDIVWSMDNNKTKKECNNYHKCVAFSHKLLISHIHFSGFNVTHLHII